MSAFKRLLGFSYQSTDTRNLDLAVKLGMNWIMTAWIGHTLRPPKFGDDLPVLFENDPKVARYRRARNAEIQEHIARLREYHRAAHDRGLKICIWSYEPSVPIEMRMAYPEAFYPYPKAFVDRLPGAEKGWLMCMHDERVQKWVANKVEETLRNIGPVEAWVYTTNETMWGACCVNHVCANCYNEPRWRGLRLLRDAMQAGAGRVDYPVEMIYRFWGAHHPDGYRRRNRTYMRAIRPLHDHSYDNACAEVLEPQAFEASRDVPLFMKSLEDEKSKPWIMSKTTWSDYLLHQPPNPWIGHSKGKVHEIIELSIEPCHQELYGFIPCMLLKQMQLHMQYGLERGAEGVMIYPMEGNANWELNLANLDVGMKLIENPHANLETLLSNWLEQTYDGKFPGWLVRDLLDTEDIWADIASYNGICGLVNFDCVLMADRYLLNYQKYYLWPLVKEAWPDGETRFDLTQSGMSKALAVWNRQLARAEAMNAKVKAEIDTLPPKARAHILHFFDRFMTLTIYMSLHHKLLYTRMALELKKLEPTPALMRVMEKWSYQIFYLIASDQEIRERGFLGRNASALQADGWRIPELTEVDAFPGLGDAREVVVNGFQEIEGPTTDKNDLYYRPRWF